MENKLDKLFRAKLEHQSVPVAPHAWDKVAAGLGKKNAPFKVSVYYRIAAGIALMLAVAGYAYLSSDTPTQHKLATETKTVEPDQPKETTETTVVPEDEKLKAGVKTEKASPKTKRQVPKLTASPMLVAQNVANETAVANMTPEPQGTKLPETVTPIMGETVALNEPIIEPKAEPVVEQPKQKSMVVVYNLTAPTEEPLKQKPLKKMLNFAKDVRGGETALASVRTLKNNLFGYDETTIENESKNN